MSGLCCQVFPLSRAHCFNRLLSRHYGMYPLHHRAVRPMVARMVQCTWLTVQVHWGTVAESCSGLS